MFSIWARFGTLAIAAALLFAALRVHKSTGRNTRVTKTTGVVLAFVAGCAFLVTFVGSWMAGVARSAGALFVAGLIVCTVIIVIDCLFDKKPDKPAFWAAFALAAVMVFGAASIPQATGQVKAGFSQVGDQVQKIPAGSAPQPAKKK
jgi:hypothetical protein